MSSKRRVWIAVFLFTLVIINYMDRVALSVAAKPIAAEFGLSPVAMGYLFSSFLWTYVLCLVPIGMLVERTGTKRMIGGGIALWSLATMATGLAWSFGSVLAARLVMGASEATSFPASGRVIRDWVPEKERGVVTTLFNGGSSAGPAFGALITSALVALFDWRIAFFVLGAVGFVWLAAWLRWFDQPERASWLSTAERDLILRERNGEAGHVDAPPPSSLRYLLSQPTVWGLVVTQACVVYTAYLFLTWLPSYLQSTQSLSMGGTGLYTALPYLLTMILGLLVARFSDRSLSSAAVQAGGRRRFVAAMALLPLVLLMAPSATSMWQLMVILTLVLTGATTASGLNFALTSDLLRNPRDISRAMSIVAFGGNSFGLAAPIITGYIVGATGGYTWAFRVAALLLVCGAATTLLFTRRPIPAENETVVLVPQAARA
jgi:ACS family glucarate transporter-like MFS transporter